MDIIKIIGVGFVTLILTVMLKDYRRDFAIYASLIGGAIILYYAIDYLKNIVSFLDSLVSTGISKDFIVLLVKITGISILTEFAVSICRDMGESAIANKVDLGGKLLVISLSIPVISGTLSGLLELLQ
jgi:stage III sporulation protein AD